MTTLGSFSLFRGTFALGGAPTGVDGLEEWPLPNVRLPGSGFGDEGSTFKPFQVPLVIRAGYTNPIFQPGNPVNIFTINNLAEDAVSGFSEYDWYLSQKTDLISDQVMEMAHLPGWLPNSRSGTIVLALSASLIGVNVGDILTPDQVFRVFNRTYIYVQRRSDKAIQVVDLNQVIQASE